MLATAAAHAEETSPTPTGAQNSNYAAIVQRTISGYIVPAYQRLLIATTNLTKATDAYCAGPGEESKAAFTAAFAETVQAWAGVDFLRFGPMAREGRFERFSFWPDVHGTGARQLRQMLSAEDASLLQPGGLDRQSAAVQGFPALESLMFLPDKGVLASNSESPYRCSLALAVARNMNTIAALALAGWTGSESWAALMEKPGASNPVYATSSEAMTEILKAILTGIEQDRDLKIQPALGKTEAEAQPGRAPFPLAGQTLPYLRGSIQALKSFIDTSEVLMLLPASEQTIVSSYEAGFRALAETLDSAGDDFKAAIVEPDSRVKLAQLPDTLASLRDLFHYKLFPTLGLSAGFNALDGD
jgi:predicted lipoprotein